MTEKITQNSKLIISNKVKITLGVILMIMITTIAIYPIMDTNTRFQQVKDGYNNDIFYGPGRQCLSRGGYNNLIKHSDKQDFFLQKFDVLNPKYVIVRNIPKSDYTDNMHVQYLEFVELKRNGLFSFEPLQTQGGEILNKTWDEATKILQNNNLLENNPDTKNISLTPAKSPEELAKIAEQYCNQPEQENLELKYQAPEEKSTDELRQENSMFEIEINMLNEEKLTATSKRKEEIDYEIMILGEFIRLGKEELQKRGVTE